MEHFDTSQVFLIIIKFHVIVGNNNNSFKQEILDHILSTV